MRALKLSLALVATALMVAASSSGCASLGSEADGAADVAGVGYGNFSGDERMDSHVDCMCEL